MIPEYIHFNESCIIDPMLLPELNKNNNNNNINNISDNSDDENNHDNNNNNNNNISHTNNNNNIQTLTPSPSVPDKSTQRNSIISHYSTTTSGSTYRDSFASSDSTNEFEELQARQQQQWSAEQTSIGHVRSERPPSTTFSSSSLQPSSRYLLSGAPNSETFRQQELHRFYPIVSSSPPSSFSISSSLPQTSTPKLSPSRKAKALSDPFISMPSIAVISQPIEFRSSSSQSHHPHYSSTNTISSSTTTISTSASSTHTYLDPWTTTAVKLALDHAICKDWLYKYEQPTFAFSRSWKRRFTVLSDKTLYVFKSSKTILNSQPCDRFLLTDDTLVFVSEEFKKGCVIEIRKPLCKWYIKCESITQMKNWLEIMKKVVACIKLNYQQGPITLDLLNNLSLTDDARLLIKKITDSSTQSNPFSFQNQLIQQQKHQRSQSQRMPPLSKRLLSYNKKRNSTPPTSLTTPSLASTSLSSTESSQKHPTIASFSLFTSSSFTPNNNTTKRQSLAQIPHWERNLPPQLPPPTTLPPPPPIISNQQKKNSNESLPTHTNQLPTVDEMI